MKHIFCKFLLCAIASLGLLSAAAQDNVVVAADAESNGANRITATSIPSFIKTPKLSLDVDAVYDISSCLNLPADYTGDGYSITTSIDGVKVKDDTYACVYRWFTFVKPGTYTLHVVAAATSRYARTEGNIAITVGSEPDVPVVTEERLLACDKVTWSNPETTKLTTSVNGFDITCVKNSGSSSPVYNSTNQDLRLYAKNSITIYNPYGFNRLVFNLSAQGLKRLAPITPDCGMIAEQSAGDKTVVWSSSKPVKSVTIAVGDHAIYGTEPTKAGQLDFTSIEVSKALAPSKVYDTSKYIDGLKAGVGSFSLEQLYEVVNSALGK